MEFEAFGGTNIRDKQGLIDTDRLKEEAENISEERLRDEDTEVLVDEIMDGETLTPPKVRTDQSERTVESEPPDAKVKVEMPATGDVELLQYPTVPLSSRDEPFEVEWDGQTLWYVLEVADTTAPKINKEIDHREHMLSFHSEESADKIKKKNENARRAVRGVVKRRKEEIKSEEEKLDEILDPDEDDEDVPQFDD